MLDSYFGETFYTPYVESLLNLDSAMEAGLDAEDIDGYFYEALNFCQVAEPEELPKRYLGYAFIETMKLSAACGGGYYFDSMDELDYELALEVPSGYGGLVFVAQYLLAFGDLESLLQIYIDSIHDLLPDAMSAVQYDAYAEASYS